MASHNDCRGRAGGQNNSPELGKVSHNDFRYTVCWLKRLPAYSLVVIVVVFVILGAQFAREGGIVYVWGLRVTPGYLSGLFKGRLVLLRDIWAFPVVAIALGTSGLVYFH